MPLVVKTVVHFERPADDVNRLSKFYKDVFGWKFEKARCRTSRTG